MQNPVTPTSNDERNWAMFCHLGALAGVIIPLGKESLNFQITIIIGFAISFILMFVLIGFLFIFILGILDIVFIIVAAIKVSEGVNYRYPVALRLTQ